MPEYLSLPSDPRALALYSMRESVLAQIQAGSCRDIDQSPRNSAVPSFEMIRSLRGVSRQN